MAGTPGAVRCPKCGKPIPLPPPGPTAVFNDRSKADRPPPRTRVVQCPHCLTPVKVPA